MKPPQVLQMEAAARKVGKDNEEIVQETSTKPSSYKH